MENSTRLDNVIAAAEELNTHVRYSEALEGDIEHLKVCTAIPTEEFERHTAQRLLGVWYCFRSMLLFSANTGELAMRGWFIMAGKSVEVSLFFVGMGLVSQEIKDGPRGYGHYFQITDAGNVFVQQMQQLTKGLQDKAKGAVNS